MEKAVFKEALRLGRVGDFDFEKLLEPYREGGTEEKPVVRTWGTLIAWLTGKLKFPVDVVGAAVLVVCLEMRNGLEFPGDRGYGSAGDQLAQHLRKTCYEIRQRQLADEVFLMLGKRLYSQLEPMVVEKVKRMMKPFWKRWF